MIKDLRIKISEIDLKMMELFKERALVSKKIGEYKHEKNLPVLDVKREEELLEKYRAHFNDDKLWSEYEKIFKMILEISKELQKWKYLGY